MTDGRTRKEGEQRERSRRPEETQKRLFVRSRVFLRVIIVQIRPCFLLIRSAVSQDLFKETYTQTYAQTDFLADSASSGDLQYIIHVHVIHKLHN